MSDSTPDQMPGADERVALNPVGKSPGAASARWWMISLVFHGVLLSWLLFFSPVRFFNPAEKPKVHLSPTQTKKVVDDILSLIHI